MSFPEIIRLFSIVLVDVYRETLPVRFELPLLHRMGENTTPGLSTDFYWNGSRFLYFIESILVVFSYTGSMPRV